MPDRKLTEVLASRPFTLSAEVMPPRNGSEQGKILDQIEKLVGAGAQFLAVTKGAGGSLRGGSLPIAQAIKEQFGVPCVAHFTCRDLTPEEVENQLMDHHYFGIRNILALRGDPPEGQPGWKAREGGYNYAHELIRQIRDLNSGRYLSRPGTGPAGGAEREATEFCIGAAVYPEHEQVQERATFFRAKVDAGAEFGITQMIFDADAYSDFLELCAREGVFAPVLPGTRVLRTRAQAQRVAAKFGVSVPPDMLGALAEEDSPDAAKRGMDCFLKLTERLRTLGAPGIHLFVLGDTDAALQAIQGIRYLFGMQGANS